MATNKQKDDTPNGKDAAKNGLNKAAGKSVQAKTAKAGAKVDEAKGKKPAPKKPAEQEPNFLQKTKQFFREVRIELKKVSWPSRKETIASTSVILVLVFIIAVFLGIMDIAVAKALRLILH